MVVDTDRAFHALADPTRRDILGRVLRSEFAVSAIAREYPMTFAAVQKHVAVLESAGLVRKRKQGRERLVSGVPTAITSIRGVLDEYERLWRGRIDRIGEMLAEEEGQE